MTPSQQIFEFGPYRVDGKQRVVWRDGKPLPIHGKPVDALLVLLQHHGRLVEKSELLHEVWNDAFVEDGNIAVAISMLRKALRDDDGQHQYIQTVPRRGYMFVAEVRTCEHNDLSPPQNGHISSLPDDQQSEPRAGIPVSKPGAVGRWARAPRPMLWIGAALLIVLTTGLAVHLRLVSAARPALHSVAVLPFRVLNPAEQPPLGLMITDAVITELARDGAIDVRPTSAVYKYVDQPPDPITAGREQKVDAILAGNLEFVGDHLRVHVQLVRTADASLIWADRFEQPAPQRALPDDEIADSIVEAVAPQFGSRKRSHPSAHQPSGPKAYQLYMQGRYFWNKRTEDGLRRSIQYFQQATLEDQQYAAAYAGLADAYALLASYGVEAASQAYPNAKAAALRALQLDPSLAEAYTSLGMISFYYEWNWAEADRQFRHSITLNPNYPLAHTWFALDLAATGRCPEAISEIQRAHDLDPLSLSVNSEVGRIFYWCHQPDRAVDSLRAALDLDPHFARAHTKLGMAYAAQRNFSAAIREFETARQLSGPDPYLDGLKAYALGASGHTTAAQHNLADLIRRSRTEFVPAFSIALACIGVGDRDRAFEWLSRAYDDRSTYLVYANGDPLLDGLRTDKRFSDLLHRMSLDNFPGRNH